MLAVRIDSVKNPPWGMAGGMAGGAGRVVVNPGTNHERQLQPLSDGNMLKRGDVLRIETGGGGGYGHPFDRPPESVLDDVLGGFVTARRGAGALWRRHRRRHGRSGPDAQAAHQASRSEGFPSSRLCRRLSS